MKQPLLLKTLTLHQSTFLYSSSKILFTGLMLCLTLGLRPAQAQLTKIWEVPDIKYSPEQQSSFVQEDVDQAGNLVILGSRLTLFKYDATGKQLWSNQYKGSSDSSYLSSGSLWLDKSDNMYVLGRVGTSSDVYDDVLLKYGAAGDLLWSKVFTNKSGNMVRIETIALDREGNVYLTGYMNDAGAMEMGTQKLSDTGTVQWTSKEAGLSSGEVIEVDNKGSVFVLTSSSEVVVGSESVILLKYDAASGTNLMQRSFHTPRGPGYSETAEKLLITKTGEIYAIVGTSNGSGGVLKVFLHKIAADGTLIYKNQIGQTDAAVFFDAAFTANEELLFLCREQKYRTTWDHFMTKVDANGQHLWLHKFNVYEANNMVRYFAPAPTGMSVNTDGSIAISGSYSYFRIPPFSASTVYTEYPKFILATFTKDGTETWRQVMEQFTYRDGKGGVSYINTKSLYFVANSTEGAGSYTAANLTAMKFQDCASFKASAGADKEICTGDNVQLEASGGKTYVWAPATGLSATNIAAPVASPAETTTYIVTVTNADGCTATDEVIVKVNARPTATVTADGETTFCEGGSLVLNANQGTGYSYQWYKDGNPINQATGSSFTTYASGDFTVKVTMGSGCTATSSPLKITVNKPVAVIAGAAQSVCANAAAFTLEGFSPAGGTWSGKGVNAAGVFNPATAGVGNHTLTYMVSQNNCRTSGTKTITVTPAAATPGAISGSVTVCPGTTNLAYSVIGVAGAENYTWTVPTGFTITSGQGTTSVMVTAGSKSGNITVKANNSCGASEASTIAVNVSIPTIATITAEGNTTFCEGGSVILKATAGSNYSYQWLRNDVIISGANAANYNATTAGSYTVRITDGSCAQTSSPVAVNVTATISNNAITSGNKSVCAGAALADLQGSIPTGGSGNYSYQWKQSSDGINFSNINGAASQHYNPGNLSSTTWFKRVVMAGSCHSTSDAIKVTINAAPTVALSAFDKICTDDEVLTLAGGQPAGGSYSGTGISNGVFDPVAAGVGEHTITYTYTDANGCSATATRTIIVQEACNVTGVEDKEPSHKFVFFPNPARDELNLEVELPERTDVTLQLIDARGSVILQQNHQGQVGGFKTILQLENKSRGMYFLRFTTKDGSYNRKVLLW